MCVYIYIYTHTYIHVIIIISLAVLCHNNKLRNKCMTSTVFIV